MAAKIVHKIERPPKNLIKEFRRFATPQISDAMDRSGAMVSEIKPFFGNVKICGPAIPVREMVGNNLMCHKAIYVAEAGDVIVVDARGHKDTSVWGAIMCLAAKMRGIEGVVIDGAVRDSMQIKNMRFPIFARAVAPNGAQKNWPGHINVPIQCAGVQVKPGDIIVGDDDGVVVVPLEEAENTLSKVRVVAEIDRKMSEEIKRGKTTIDLLGIDERLKSLISFGVHVKK